MSIEALSPTPISQPFRTDPVRPATMRVNARHAAAPVLDPIKAASVYGRVVDIAFRISLGDHPAADMSANLLARQLNCAVLPLWIVLTPGRGQPHMLELAEHRGALRVLQPVEKRLPSTCLFQHANGLLYLLSPAHFTVVHRAEDMELPPDMPRAEAIRAVQDDFCPEGEDCEAALPAEHRQNEAAELARVADLYWLVERAVREHDQYLCELAELNEARRREDAWYFAEAVREARWQRGYDRWVQSRLSHEAAVARHDERRTHEYGFGPVVGK